jgi:putative glutamine amidotransferase
VDLDRLELGHGRGSYVPWLSGQPIVTSLCAFLRSSVKDMAEDRPVIGLCAALERARWGVWETAAHLLPREYADAVQRAGGIALLLPPDPRAIEHPDEILGLLDGLILAGGSDIDPAAYGEQPHLETINTNPERDAFEIALATRAVERDLPFLGICRGMQVLNVARGGSLLQHLPESHGHDDHRRTPGTFVGADHPVRLAAGSLAARAAGETEHRTLSHHHQAVDRLGDGLVVTGHSTLDDLPEAVELPGSRFVLGVQWHPEADETSRLIASLVADARERVAERAGRAA